MGKAPEKPAARGSRLVKCVVWIGAVAFYGQIALAIFGFPRAFTDWLTCAAEPPVSKPRTIVVLGGGGIPSETGLMRTYYGASTAKGAPGAKVIVCLPADKDPEKSSVGRMRDELVLRGVPKASIQMEFRGLNTHEQAAGVRRMLGEDALGRPTVIVTSPSHARRALMCFRKEGFKNVGCVSAEGVGAEADLGGNEGWRYSFWSGLQREAEFLRELVAMAMYKARGWM